MEPCGILFGKAQQTHAMKEIGGCCRKASSSLTFQDISCARRALTMNWPALPCPTPEKSENHVPDRPI